MLAEYKANSPVGKNKIVVKTLQEQGRLSAELKDIVMMRKMHYKSTEIAQIQIVRI